MLRPDWVPAPAWGRLEAALRGPSGHLGDLIADLEAATARWRVRDRLWLLERVIVHAEAGAPAPAAFILGLSDLLESDG